MDLSKIKKKGPDPEKGQEKSDAKEEKKEREKPEIKKKTAPASMPTPKEGGKEFKAPTLPPKPAVQENLFGPADFVYNTLQCQIQRVKDMIDMTVGAIVRKKGVLEELEQEYANLQRAARETQKIGKPGFSIGVKGPEKKEPEKKPEGGEKPKTAMDPKKKNPNSGPEVHIRR